MAFQEYRMGDFPGQSEWVGFKQFIALFTDKNLPLVLRNTLAISGLKLTIGFVCPIVFAVFLNEMHRDGIKKVIQTISYLPHFISWTVCATLLFDFLKADGGAVNELLMALHLIQEPIDFFGRGDLFWGLALVSDTWKELGWNSIIFISAMAGVDAEMYEAADIDGANGIEQFFNITIPLLSPTIFFVSITRIIGGMQVFDLIFMVMDRNNPALYKTQSIVYLFYQNSFVENNKGYGSTIVVLLIAIIMVITVFQMIAQKKWVYYN